MNKSRKESSPIIMTHADLMAERKRLENQIVIHKALLIREFELVRTEVAERLQPATQALDTVRNIRKIIQSPPVLAVIGAFVLKKIIDRQFSKPLSPTGWLPVIGQLLANQLLKRSDIHK